MRKGKKCDRTLCHAHVQYVISISAASPSLWGALLLVLATRRGRSRKVKPQMTSNKRQRTPSGSRLSPSSPSPSLTPEPEPMYKSSRITQEASGDRRLLCTLPPTCNPPHNHPTPIANSRDLELHYGKYHAQVCEQKGCGFVFPDARLLELVSGSRRVWSSASSLTLIIND